MKIMHSNTFEEIRHASFKKKDKYAVNKKPAEASKSTSY